MARRVRCFVSLLLLLAVAGLPALGLNNKRVALEKTSEPHGSLKGVLRALERRRRAPQGAYPLASYQDPQDADYFASRDDYLPENIEHPQWKDVVLGYLDRDDDYPADNPNMNYKNTVFRERNEQLKSELKDNPSAFRELESKNNLQEIFASGYDDKDEDEQSDDEYADLLRKLWEKYKHTYGKDSKDYKRSIKKRQIPGEYYPGGAWRPIAFKRKRSSNQRLDNTDPPDFLYSLKFVSQSDPAAVENLKDDKIVDEEEDSDIAAIINSRARQPQYDGFEPLDSQTSEFDDDKKLALQPLSYPSDEMYLPDGSEIIETPIGSENAYAITKRSSNARAYENKNLENKSRKFRSTFNDPKVMKDLSSIFGAVDNNEDRTIQKPVKRSSSPDEESHESNRQGLGLPPSIVGHQMNESSHESIHNDSNHYDQPHSRHEHENKPPMMTGNVESDHSHEGQEKKVFEDDDATHINVEHPIILKKKSIDWSKYFGIDRRKKKSMNGMQFTNKQKRYMNSFGLKNLEGISDNGGEEKRKSSQIEQAKLDKIENKLKNIEASIVDDVYEYTTKDTDTKEEQEIKDKLISSLATAYNAEKMRKAIFELKSLMHSGKPITEKPLDSDEDTEKRSFKKINKPKTELDPEDVKALMDDEESSRNKPKTNLDPEDIKALLKEDVTSNKPTTKLNPENIQAFMAGEQKTKLDPEDIKALLDEEEGAGHFLNGPIETMSEGFMGGNDVEDKGCPILDRIIRRCHNVDVLAGDHGQLFLPLCSLHQVCYICGPSSRTGCDLIFLSEADSACGGHPRCQSAARNALMALRELHEPLVHCLQGECSRDSCLNRPPQENKPAFSLNELSRNPNILINQDKKSVKKRGPPRWVIRR